MTDLYLIAHKVRGEPAFDIAQEMTCPMCDGHGDIPSDLTCFECDGTGRWWIIPTSGHRAYPYNTALLVDVASILDGMPPSLPDHYAHKAAPSIDLATALGLTKPKPSQPTKPFPRRI